MYGEDGKPVDKTYLEKGLPLYLQQDIDALVKGRAAHSSLLDCLECEVYGSINSALYSEEISDEQAWYLREKYLDLKKEVIPDD